MLPHLLVWLLALLPGDVVVVGATVLTRSSVPADIVLAVSDCESGNLPEARRDRFVSTTGDVGRMQVNLEAHWKHLGYESKADAREALRYRFTNVAAGLHILTAVHARAGRPDGFRWVSRYNGGGPRAKAYALKVQRKVEGWKRGRPQRRW